MMEHKNKRGVSFVRSCIRLWIVLAAVACSINSYGQELTTPKDGDIVFHESTSRQSPVIKLAQHSRWTHCGIVFHIDGKAYVYEAVDPVKYTKLEDWIARGKKGVCRVKRLKRGELPSKSIEKMMQVGRKYKGKRYDLKFQWSDDKMYCSELIWKIYHHGAGIDLCTPKHFSDYSLSAPGVRRLIRKRYGSDFNPSETVVAPADLFNSKMLKEVKYY